MGPTVSLALPVHDGENFIAEALYAILSQDFADFELIITDNASQDRTEEICRDHAARDPRIRYYRNPSNWGAAENLNGGFARATGTYFKWCAHDDLMSPNFLGACVRALDENPLAVLAYGRCAIIDSHARRLGMRDIPTRFAPEKNLMQVVGHAEVLMFGLFRAEALKKTCLHRKYYGSDQALIAEAALLGTFVHVPEATFFSREHAGRSNRIEDRRARAAWQATDGSNRFGLEQWHLTFDLMTIAARRRQGALRTAASVMFWATAPQQLSRFLLELIGIASPRAQLWLRRMARKVLDAHTGKADADTATR